MLLFLLALGSALLPSGSRAGGGSDDCASPEAIAGPGVFAFDNSTATTGTQGQSDPICKAFGTTSVGHDVWFVWTSDVTGAASLTTCGEIVDTKVAAWPGGACPIDGTALGCSDDICGLQSGIVWPVRAGASYMLQIGTFAWSPGGAGTFEIETLAAAEVASYDAGLEGLPPTAPDPVTEGWTLVDPSMGAVGLSDVSPDGASGLNAWQIDDAVSAPDGRAYYEQLISPMEAWAAYVIGFELELELRFLDGVGDDLLLEVELAFPASTAARVFGVRVRPSGPDLLATDVANGTTFVLAGANDGQYHELAIRSFHQGFPLPFLELDGAGVGSLSVLHQFLGAGVRWGASSGPGTVTANVHSVRLELPEPPVPTTPDNRYCAGSGAGAPCPCGNEELDYFGGCENSTGDGASVQRFGASGVGNERFRAFGLVPGQAALLFVGEQPIAGGDGVPFGDGLRCVGTNVVRLGIELPDPSGVAEWGPGLDALGGWTLGDLRYFQVWYRDPVGSPCGSGFNLSSGLRLEFLD